MAHQLVRTLNSSVSKVHFLQGRGVVVCLKNSYYGRGKIGEREVVGFGINGEYSYADRMDFPCPAIRFKEVKGELAQLREKEKGDWKKLTDAEKKQLYRTSFCRTFAECQAPSGEWKSVLGSTLILTSIALWLFILMKKFVYQPLDESFSPEWKQKQLEYMIALRIDPIDGVSSKWDYENNRWKE
ncbi:Mitochondrial cytochrome c oxidase subunit [Halotydeus destructor]|nr:Mitochondrial cytochrome c oxidase subunit [Halotydeus destructor]